MRKRQRLRAIISFAAAGIQFIHANPRVLGTEQSSAYITLLSITLQDGNCHPGFADQETVSKTLSNTELADRYRIQV